MSAGDATIAARVTREFRQELEARRDELAAAGVHYPDGRPVDLSYMIRFGLRAYLDNSLVPADGAVRPLELKLGSLDHEPASHRGDAATSHKAARNSWPRARSQRHEALHFLYDAAVDGMTGDELDELLGGYNGRRRLSDLKAGGWAEVRRVRGESVTRKTRTGALAEVYVLTAAAEARVAQERREARDEAA